MIACFCAAVNPKFAAWAVLFLSKMSRVKCKKPNFFFEHYLQKQFYPFYTCLLGKPHQHPPGTPSPKDGTRAFIYPPLDPHRVVLRYPGEVRSLWDLPPNHAVSVLATPSFKCAVWMAIVLLPKSNIEK